MILHAAVLFCTNSTFVTHTTLEYMEQRSQFRVSSRSAEQRERPYLLFVEEVQVDPLGREAVRQELREARLLHLHVLAHQVERDLGVKLAEKLPARAAGDAELALQLLAVHCDSPKVLVTLQY